MSSTCCLDQTLVVVFFAIINLNCVCECVWKRENYIVLESLTTDVCVCVCMLEDCCVNVWETMGKFSPADSLWWGWGNTGGDSHGEVVVCLGGKNRFFKPGQRFWPHEIRIVTKWIFSVSDPKCLCNNYVIIKWYVLPNWQPLAWRFSISVH